MPRHPKNQGPQYRNRRRGGPGERRRMAIIFAITLGWVGTHRFTLGQWQWGLFHIFLFVVSMFFAGQVFGIDPSPWLTLSAFVAYYHAWKWYKMSDEEFGEHFLERVDVSTPVQGRYLAGTEVVHPKVLSSRSRSTLLASAKTAYETFDYQLAAERYEQALDLDLGDGESRVLAARCYALLEDAPAAYRHLAKAVALRASNLGLVASDPDFAWLRTQPDFALRRTAGFALVEVPVSRSSTTYANSNHTSHEHNTADPSSSTLGPPQLPPPANNLLDSLERLAQLRERGILNEVEFAREKERLLRA